MAIHHRGSPKPPQPALERAAPTRPRRRLHRRHRPDRAARRPRSFCSRRPARCRTRHRVQARRRGCVQRRSGTPCRGWPSAPTHRVAARSDAAGRWPAPGAQTSTRSMPPLFAFVDVVRHPVLARAGASPSRRRCSRPRCRSRRRSATSPCRHDGHEVSTFTSPLKPSARSCVGALAHLVFLAEAHLRRDVGPRRRERARFAAAAVVERHRLCP